MGRKKNGGQMTPEEVEKEFEGAWKEDDSGEKVWEVKLSSPNPIKAIAKYWWLEAHSRQEKRIKELEYQLKCFKEESQSFRKSMVIQKELKEWHEKRIERLEKQIEIQKVAINRWVPCPDHRDKVNKGCYVCKIEKLKEGIKEALKTIYALHGEIGWELYRDNAPEMKKLQKLLEEKDE